MQLQILLICTVLCLKPPQNDALLSGYAVGSLSGQWKANFTVFMDNFKGSILYLTDYERNMFIVKADIYKDRTKMVLILMYNNDVQSIYLDSLCGCDPCNKALVNLAIRGTYSTIMVECNNVGYFSLSKTNTKNRYNPAMLPVLQKLTPPMNQIFIVVVITTRGCLNYFLFDQMHVTFKKDNSDFLRSCPRRCVKDTCNKGKCQLMNFNRPLCDCSSVALNGPRCKNALRTYDRGSNTSYQLINDDYNIIFKFTWRRFSDKRFCLLQFDHKGIQETLSIYGPHLMRGATIIGDIDAHGINFITLSLHNNMLKMKANNKLIDSRRVLLENTQINIGFSKSDDKCATFEGDYDLLVKGTGLRPVKISNDDVYITDRSVQVPVISMTSKFILGGVVIFFLIGICISFIVAIERRKGTRRDSLGDDNTYDVEFRFDKSKHETKCQDDEYDWVDPSKAYRLSENDKSNRLCENDNELPVLPPRHF